MALEMARILCPVDFSPCARGALELAVELAARLGASVDVLHVWEPVRYAAPEPLVPGPIEGDRVRFEGQRDLDALVAFARERAAAVPVRGRLETGDARDTILRLAEGEPYDLIVMGTHGWTGIAHLLMGSVAENVVRRARCPVLTIRAARAIQGAAASASR